MFLLDVSKVDLGVAHVAMATYACFKRVFQVFHLFSIHVYVANASSRCFKSRSGVACRRPVAAASASPWFTCRSLRPTDASAARICRRGRWCGSQFHRAGVGRVPPCRCWMGRGCVVSTVRCAGFARATVSNAGTDWEQDRTCGMHA